MSNWQWRSFGLDNGMAPNKRQTIIEPMLIRFIEAYMNNSVCVCVCVCVWGGGGGGGGGGVLGEDMYLWLHLTQY